jgi:hypothetical protein
MSELVTLSQKWPIIVAATLKHLRPKKHIQLKIIVIFVWDINVIHFTDPFDIAICSYIFVLNLYTNADGNTVIVR